MKEFEFKPGDEVAHDGDVWIVESARAVAEVSKDISAKDVKEEKSGYKIVRLVWHGGILDVERKGVAACEVSALQQPDAPLTAAEYADKLKAVFGEGEKIAQAAGECGSCSGMKCEECPLEHKKRRSVGFTGSCCSMVWYRPDLAAKLMDEWLSERDKPKRKTYLEDFREKMPNAYIDPNFGTPAACRKRMYYHETDDLKCGQKDECQKCWNKEMPEVSDNAEG